LAEARNIAALTTPQAGRLVRAGCNMWVLTLRGGRHVIYFRGVVRIGFPRYRILWFSRVVASLMPGGSS
jgi:hypothetical protein